MKRFLLLLVAFLLPLLTLGQSLSTTAVVGIAPKLSCTSLNKFGTTSIRSAVLSGSRRLYGVNVTDGACAPSDPFTAATLLSSYGFNWVRLHHVDRGLKEGWFTVAQVLAFEDALYAKGIRCSVDGTSKLGEVYSRPLPDGSAISGLDAFKRDLYDANPVAEALYKENLDRITPILKHKATFMACLVNEGGHLTTPGNALTFWQKWSPEFRKINPDLLLSDTPDGCDQGQAPDWGEPWRKLAVNYDLILCHYYNSDGWANGQGNNIFDGWNWGHVTQYDGLGKRILVQEFGSYKSNPYEGANIAFVLLECLRRGYGSCQFAFATNEAAYRGLSADVFTMTNDPLRLDLALLGAYLVKYGSLGGLASWGGDTGNWGGAYSYTCPDVVGTESYVLVKGYLWQLDKRLRYNLVKPVGG
jgi:hypothetical protein